MRNAHNVMFESHRVRLLIVNELYLTSFNRSDSLDRSTS